MTQHDTLIAHARAMGEAFAQGKLVTSNGFDSARIQALLPAIAAIENDVKVFTAELPGQITRAYADGSKKPYGSAKSEATAVSKTTAFLRAASVGLASKVFVEVKRVITTQNDEKIQARMSKGIFEKIWPIMRDTANDKAVPSSATIMAALDPVDAPDVDKELAARFKKLSTLTHEVAKMGGEKYHSMAVTALQYETLQSQHEARAKRNALDRAAMDDNAASVQTRLQEAGLIPQVTLQSDNVEVKPDIVDGTLDNDEMLDSIAA